MDALRRPADARVLRTSCLLGAPARDIQRRVGWHTRRHDLDALDHSASEKSLGPPPSLLALRWLECASPGLSEGGSGPVWGCSRPAALHIRCTPKSAANVTGERAAFAARTDGWPSVVAAAAGLPSPRRLPAGRRISQALTFARGRPRSTSSSATVDCSSCSPRARAAMAGAGRSSGVPQGADFLMPDNQAYVK